MLALWRRHLKDCPHRIKGRAHIKCACPIWCDGEVNGKRIRKSMDTRDWARAMRNLGKIEDPAYGMQFCLHSGCRALVRAGRCASHTREIAGAVSAYHEAHPDLEPETKRKRLKVLRFLGSYWTAAGFELSMRSTLKF